MNEDFACHGNSSSFGEGVELLECDSGIGIYTWEEGDSDESAELASVLSEHADGSEYVVASDTWALTHFQHGQALQLQETFGGEVVGSENLGDYLSPLQSAYVSCEGESIPSVTYDDDYEVLTISRAFAQDPASSSGSTNSNFGSNINAAYQCVMGEIDAPAHVESDISRTRALDGTRETSWGDFDASWTYHPDSGLNIHITDTSA